MDWDRPSYNERETETQTQREEGHETVRAETGVMELQAEEFQGWPVIPGS